MSYSPGTIVEMNSPDIFASDIRCNLDSQFLDARDSIKSSNMEVFARIRPMLPHETEKGFQECISIDDNIVRVKVPKTSAKYKSSRTDDEIIEEYTFSAAYSSDTGQFVFFQETMLNTIQNFVEGNNSLVFNYGITGSGKTFTLQGNTDNPGVIPLTLKLYFASVEKQLLKDIVIKPSQYCDIIALSEKEAQQEYLNKKQLLSMYDKEIENAPGTYRSFNSKSFAMSLCDFFYDDYEAEEQKTTLCAEDMAAAQAAAQLKEVCRKSAHQQLGVSSVWVSFVEIYNENIFDLLQPFSNSRTKLSLGEDKNGNVYIKGVREINVSNSDEALKLLNIGRKQLSIASTKMNYQSSRSHCIYTIRVVRVPDPKTLSYGKVTQLSFCDLAGSERTSKTHTSGLRLKEAGAINTSLLVLGRCLEQLRNQQMGKDTRIIPFRESKLTRIFSSFFLGHGKAVMITNASPCDYTFDETLHVLKFSALARKLMVNDTFLTTSCRTLQSFNDQWQMFKANTSMSFGNESMESVESDSDIIQMKDDLIEKLLSHSEEFAKELSKVKKENVELEMKIRQEVCQEYSEYSDHLLANQRINHEEALSRIIESYKTRLKNMEKMYEKIIDDYKAKLDDTETEESFADTSVNSNTPLKVSHRHSNIIHGSDVMRKDSLILDDATENLKQKLVAVTSDLEKVKKELGESQSFSANLKIELNSSKAEKQKLSDQCVEYQKTILKLTTVAKDQESELKCLEEQLISLKMDLKDAKEKINEKDFCITELQSEISGCRSEVEEFKTKITKLDYLNTSYQTEIETYKQNIKELDHNLSSALNVYEAANKQIKSQCSITDELKNEVKIYKVDIEKLKGLNLALEGKTTKMCTDISKYESIVPELELDLSSTKAEVKSLKKDLNEKCSIICKLNEKIKEHESRTQVVTAEESNPASDSRKYEDLEKDLLWANEELESSKFNVTLKELRVEDLEKQIEEQKRKSEKYKKESNITSIEMSKLKSQLKEYDSKVTSLLKLLGATKPKHDLSGENCLKNLTNLENKIQFYLKDIETLNGEIEKLEIEKMDFKSKLSNYENKVSQLEANLAGSKEKNQSLLSEMVECLASKEQVMQHINVFEERLQQEIAEHKEKELKMEKSLDSAEAEKRKLISMVSKNEEQIKELEKQLSLSDMELKAVKDEILKKCSCVQELNDQIKSLLAEISNLKTCQKEIDIERHQLVIESALLKEERTDILNKLSLAVEELNASKIELGKIPKSKDLENEINCLVTEINNIETYRKEVEVEKQKLAEENASLKDERKDLQSKLSSAVEELSVTKKELEKISKLEKDVKCQERELKQQLELKEQEVIKYKEKLESLQEELKFTKEKLHIQSLTCKELEEEVLDLKSKIGEKVNEISMLTEAFKNPLTKVGTTQTEKNEIEDKLSSLKQLEEKNSFLSQELASLASQNTSLKEKLSELEQSSKERHNETASLYKDIEELILVNDSLGKRIQGCETDIENLQQIINLLGNIELKASQKVKKISSEIQNKISTIDDIERALCQSQRQLKNFQMSSDKKLVSEKEQHAVEIEQIMKVKHELEKETEELKKKNKKLEQKIGDALNFPCVKIEKSEQPLENESQISKSEKHELQEKSRKTKEKENIPEPTKRSRSTASEKYQSSRVLHQKQSGHDNISFSSIESDSDNEGSENSSSKNCARKKKLLEVLDEKHEGLKRPSDSDFEVPKEKTNKKMKSSSVNETRKITRTSSKQSVRRAESKVSLNQISTRTTRRKLQEEPAKHISPVQRIANRIGEKFKSVYEHVGNAAKNISSPPVTRRKRKLFNPEVSSSSDNDKIITRGRKTGGK